MTFFTVFSPTTNPTPKNKIIKIELKKIWINKKKLSKRVCLKIATLLRHDRGLRTIKISPQTAKICIN